MYSVWGAAGGANNFILINLNKHYIVNVSDWSYC